jgi:hypothetical protein
MPQARTSRARAALSVTSSPVSSSVLTSWLDAFGNFPVFPSLLVMGGPSAGAASRERRRSVHLLKASGRGPLAAAEQPVPGSPPPRSRLIVR